MSLILRADMILAGPSELKMEDKILVNSYAYETGLITCRTSRM